MEWLEATLYTSNEGVDAVCAMLMNAGVDGVEINDDIEMKKFLSSDTGQWDYVDDELLSKPPTDEACVRFYLTDNAVGNETLLAVREGIDFILSADIGVPLGRLELNINKVNDEDWLDNWKKYFKPLEIGQKVVVRPIWEDYENDGSKIVFNLNPGHVFGTGLHQTTQLCIESLEKHVRTGVSVLDIGCGTGILSIISLLLGAERAVAIDTDKNVIDIAYENAELNGIDKNTYTVLSGNVISDMVLRESCRRGFDIVVANIVADVIIALASIVPNFLIPGGVFISSGIISERIEEVKAALTVNGFEIKDIISRDDWRAVVCTYAKECSS